MARSHSPVPRGQIRLPSLAVHRFRRVALTLAAVLAVVAGTTGHLPSAHADAGRVVTLVGSLQSELGCPDDWTPTCADTELPLVSGTTYAKSFTVPAGSYEYKIVINKAWAENYGAGGAAGGANIPVTLAGQAKVLVSYDDTTHKISFTPQTLAGAASEADKALAKNSLRDGQTRERFYFLMADRFANGETANDNGGLTGGPLVTGFDPTDKGFYHGGDLKGVINKLDYIKGLGTTAIWLTPSFKNEPVQGTGADASAGYHGYWITDFTQIDPHLGTNADMKALIAAAHKKGMRVYFDIITNHTADVIQYAQNKYDYIPMSASPYKDANGNAFNPDTVADTSSFPALNLQSFPYTPVISDAEKNVKVPAWLNDPTMYHNRGNSTYEGESATYGDFSGLDDLFTERPEVETGMQNIYKSWVDFGVDGFRIDTVKHVNLQFWQQFIPAIQAEAKKDGNDKFFMFGEIYSADPQVESTYTTTGKLPAALDFGFQSAAVSEASGKATTTLRDFFASDDWFTDADSNVYESPTFLGNHDMGRIGMMLSNAGYSGTDLLNRTLLANDLMYLVRGNPINYYGDEQGFIGQGGDKDAREDMFGTQVTQYANEKLIGGATMGTGSHYGTSGTIYQHIAGLAALRAKYPALADGAQIHRYASNSAGIYALSRIDQASETEYVVAVNNATTPASATFQTYTPNSNWQPLYGSTSTLKSGKDSRLNVTVPALSVSVWKARSPMATSKSAPAVYFSSPAAAGTVSGRTEVSAAIPANTFAEVSFAYRPVGTNDWTYLGTDDNAPYRVFADTSALPKNELIEYRVVAKDNAGHISATSTYAQVGTASTSGGTGTGPVSGSVTQPDSVNVPGTAQPFQGCASSWDPACTASMLKLDANDQVWKGTFADIPAGDYQFKAAIDGSWTENYGANGAPNGGNINYTTKGGPVTYYYDHSTHYATNDAMGPIITAPGSFQSKLGCSSDWAPSCMRPWLQDPDGDGVYTWSSASIPAGTYQFKIAEGLSWDVNYGDGGVAGGGNINLSVPSDGTVVTISFNATTHEIKVITSKAGPAPDLKKAKAIFVDATTIAWPASGVPAGVDPSMLNWRLYWSAGATLSVDAEALVGSDAKVASLTYDPAGLPAATVAAHPELKGYLALKLDKKTAKQVKAILTGQVAVAMFDNLGSLIDATGVQIPYVLDALYSGKASRTSLGVSFSGGTTSFSVWAPTAQKVTLLTWPAFSADQPVSAAKRTTMSMDAGTGIWSASGRNLENVRYLYEVTVFAPTVGKVVTNDVTDPYSVALTLNSTRSVAVNLANGLWAPKLWTQTAAPKLAQSVDSTIYELHVRDFSAGDTTVPAAHRGSYLAFADDGAGTQHLKALAKAGLNTVHLLPTFDIASIQEDRTKQQAPPCDLSSYAPDSDQQQACIAKIQDVDAYNWGYDPYHYMAPEGSYASSNAAADGGTRVSQFRTMVGALHADGLRVVLDQVFNHTAASGQDATSVLDQVVPGYYQRLDASGTVYTSTCCQNTATEHAMMQKLMVDSVVTWAKQYKVDGFRFDLMGHASVANMKAVRAAVDQLTLKKDGVDGKSIYLYGEGWNFGEVADNALFTQATQGQLDGTGIGAFNDRLRDGVRGGGPFDDNPTRQGFGSGEATDPNGNSINADAATHLLGDTNLVELGLAGNLKSFTFTNTSGKSVNGTQVDYNGSPAGFASQPSENVNYVDAHDNESLWDSLTYKLPVATSMSDRIRMNTVSLATTALSQSPTFWQAGVDLLRSKSFDRNSYNSGDWFNQISWTGADNGFGHGLPMKADNEAKYTYIKPLLGNATLKPSASQVHSASDQAQDLLKLRFSTPLFRLGSAAQINAKVSFPVNGTAAQKQGVIVMRINDTVGTDADPKLSNVVVVFNATPSAVSEAVPGISGSYALSPVQASGSDPVVKGSGYANGTFTVPARTVAVFVQK